MYYHPFMEYIPRQIEDSLSKCLETFSSVVVTGPRQSGKSTLLIHMLPDYRYITLDDPVTRERALSDPRLFLSTVGAYVILDEIQWAPHLMSYIKMEIDRQRDKKGIYVFTGSQQFPLMKGLSDSLAGRIAILELLPLSHSEKKSSLKFTNTLSAFSDAALMGSYPELTVNRNMDAQMWFGSYVQTYLERDVRTLARVGNILDFQRFIQLLAGRCSQLLNMTHLANEIGVSVPTIKNWISILEASGIIFLLPPYHSNLGKRIVKSPKVYFLDIGLVCYLTGIKDQDHLLNGPMAGPLFENFCIQETVKCFCNRGQKTNIYFMRTGAGLEVDIIIEESFNRMMAVEVKLTKTPNTSMGSNLRRFRRVFEAFDVHKSIILSLNDESFPMGNNIFSSSLEDYLAQI